MVMRLRVAGWAFAVALAVLGVCVVAEAAISARAAQVRIAENVFRFHVLANSNSRADQRLKLMVRDGVLEYVQEMGADLRDGDGGLAGIERRAEGVVREAGFDYAVRAVVGWYDFPTQEYGEIALPAGRYHALRIEIGEAAGNNWWCVIYPNICVAGSAAVMPAESRARLQGVLTPEEFQLITGGAPLRFRLLEMMR